MVQVPEAPAARVLHHPYQVLQLITLEAEVVVVLMVLRLEVPAVVVPVQLIQALFQLPEPQILVVVVAAVHQAVLELLHMVQMVVQGS